MGSGDTKILSIATAKAQGLPNLQAPFNLRSELGWLIGDSGIGKAVRAYRKDRIERRTRLEFGLQDDEIGADGLNVRAAE